MYCNRSLLKDPNTAINACVEPVEIEANVEALSKIINPQIDSSHHIFFKKSELFLYPNFFHITKYNTICNGLSQYDMDHDDMTH